MESPAAGIGITEIPAAVEITAPVAGDTVGGSMGFKERILGTPDSNAVRPPGTGAAPLIGVMLGAARLRPPNGGGGSARCAATVNDVVVAAVVAAGVTGLKLGGLMAAISAAPGTGTVMSPGILA